ncbi:MAG: polysaccharide deacetylase family protein [bacterium]|nr:polysaccharide deacetylase family protein [bacterium]
MKKLIMFVILGLIFADTTYALNGNYLGYAVGKSKTKEKVVALTFDDGPSKTYTPQVLAVLKKYNVKATFFMCGEQVRYYPELVKQVSIDGHEIANHSFTHPNLYKNKSLRGAGMAAEVMKTNQLIEKIVMIKPAYFRAPYNYSGKETIQAINNAGLIYVSWTFSVRDWEKPAPAIMVNMFNKNLIPGAIVLMHDGGGNRVNTVAALSGMIESAKKKGYRFVTLGELLK